MNVNTGPRTLQFTLISQVDGYDADTKALAENADHRVIIKVSVHLFTMYDVLKSLYLMPIALFYNTILMANIQVIETRPPDAVLACNGQQITIRYLINSCMWVYYGFEHV